MYYTVAAGQRKGSGETVALTQRVTLALGPTIGGTCDSTITRTTFVGFLCHKEVHLILSNEAYDMLCSCQQEAYDSAQL